MPLVVRQISGGLIPSGAGLLSLFIIYDWGCTCFENVFRLTGAAVDERVYQKLTFLAYRFGPLVNGYKSINAYHAGDGVWVEVDILLDEKCPLEIAHDIAEVGNPILSFRRQLFQALLYSGNFFLIFLYSRFPLQDNLQFC